MVKSSMMLALSVLLLGVTSAGAADLAKVNGRPITDKDLQIALSGVNEAQRDNIMKDDRSRRDLVLKLIEQEVLVQEGEKEKLDQDQDFKNAMAAFRKQYFANRVLQKNLSSKVTDKAIKNYYNTHKDRYSTDQVHVQHILVADEAQARDLIKKAKEPNADFQELAEKNSKDPSAKNNRGDLGFINRGSPFVQEFKDAAFRGSKGDILGPVKTSFGYHVIKVVDKKVGKILDFGEVELRVRNDFQQELITNYVDHLKKDAKIQIDDKALQGQ